MVKVSANKFVEHRISLLQREVESYARRLRSRALKSLEEIFKIASKVARGEIKHQRLGGKLVKITMPERQIWLKIAEEAAEAIKNLAENINEKEIQTSLKNIETLLKELTQLTAEGQEAQTH